MFVTLFLTTWSVSDVLFDNEEPLTRISGALVLLMAMYLAGTQLLMTPGLYREFRFHPHLERFGPFAAPVTGAAFGLGWTPCIGPVLASVLAVASTQGDTAPGAVAPHRVLARPRPAVPARRAGVRQVRARARLREAALAGDHVSRRDPRGVRGHPAVRPVPLVTARLQEWLRAIGLERLVEIG